VQCQLRVRCNDIGHKQFEYRVLQYYTTTMQLNYLILYLHLAVLFVFTNVTISLQLRRLNISVFQMQVLRSLGHYKRINFSADKK